MADTDKLAAEMRAKIEWWRKAPQRDLINVGNALCRAADALLEERSAREATITALEAENKRLREALEPFVAAFEKRRDAHSRRYKDQSLGYANFDKMPDKWPMETIEFSMGTFRRARDISRNRRES